MAVSSLRRSIHQFSSARFTMRLVYLAVLTAGLASIGLAEEPPKFLSLLKIADPKACDGTLCSGGCCPEAHYDCCPDGSNCANNVRNCPGCVQATDTTNHKAGGWCKEDPLFFGALTEASPCCRATDADEANWEYCNYDDDHFGACEVGFIEFCSTDPNGEKCGTNCCGAGTVNLDNSFCCYDNECYVDEDACNAAFCAGENCIASDGTPTCCLNPEVCCPSTGDCVTDFATECTDTCEDPDHIICSGGSSKSQICCPLDVDSGIGCCANGLAECDDGTGTSCSCVYTDLCDGECCPDELPHCCDDGTTCAAHLDDCGVTPPECGGTCTGVQTCCPDPSDGSIYECCNNLSQVCCDGGTTNEYTCQADETACGTP